MSDKQESLDLFDGYRSCIVWGEMPDKLARYEFKTLAEYSAFWDGVREAQGWNGCHDPEDVLHEEDALDYYAEANDLTRQQAYAELAHEVRIQRIPDHKDVAHLINTETNILNR